MNLTEIIVVGRYRSNLVDQNRNTNTSKMILETEFPKTDFLIYLYSVRWSQY